MDWASDVIAKVNDYEIFDSDLAYAFYHVKYSERVMPEDASSIEALEMKLRLMDQLITRKVLRCCRKRSPRITTRLIAAATAAVVR